MIELSGFNKMTLDNLARCLAPTVIGLNDDDDRRSGNLAKMQVENLAKMKAENLAKIQAANLAKMQAATDDVNNSIEVLTALLNMETVSILDLHMALPCAIFSSTRIVL